MHSGIHIKNMRIVAGDEHSYLVAFGNGLAIGVVESPTGWRPLVPGPAESVARSGFMWPALKQEPDKETRRAVLDAAYVGVIKALAIWPPGGRNTPDWLWERM